MNSLNALGFLMDYCDKRKGMDDTVTNERFQAAMRVIMASDDARFAHCKTHEDVLSEINWPEPR